MYRSPSVTRDEMSIPMVSAREVFCVIKASLLLWSDTLCWMALRITRLDWTLKLCSLLPCWLSQFGVWHFKIQLREKWASPHTNSVGLPCVQTHMGLRLTLWYTACRCLPLYIFVARAGSNAGSCLATPFSMQICSQTSCLEQWH